MTKPLDLRQLDHLAMIADRSEDFMVLTQEVARMRYGEFSRGRWRLHNSSVRVVQVPGLNIPAHPNPPALLMRSLVAILISIIAVSFTAGATRVQSADTRKGNGRVWKLLGRYGRIVSIVVPCVPRLTL
jgi:hypothetical protein